MKPLLKQLEAASRTGDAQAAYLLGMCAQRGLGGSKSVSKAIRCYEQAAEAGYPPAQFALGVLLSTRTGKSGKAAARVLGHFRAAARHGIVEAQFNMGLFYELGRYTRRDVGIAMRWYRRAGKAGDSDAQFRLGRLLESRGSTSAAKKWYRRAARAGVVDAQFNLALLLEGARKSADRQEARVWYRTAAELGDGAAATNLGVLYLEEGNGRRAASMAFRLFLKAAEKDDDRGLFNLGRCYELGQGVKADRYAALEAYLDAVRLGNASARKRLRTFALPARTTTTRTTTRTKARTRTTRRVRRVRRARGTAGGVELS